MNFGQALEALEAGRLVARAGWNGKGMFLYYVPGSVFRVSRPPLLGIYERDTEIQYHAHIDMKTATGECVPWLCSQTDMLAKDWEIVERAKTSVPMKDGKFLLASEDGRYYGIGDLRSSITYDRGQAYVFHYREYAENIRRNLPNLAKFAIVEI